MKIEDGTYYVTVNLSGGTGKTTLQNPTEINLSDGKISAEIVWNSPYYDYMEIEGKEYLPVDNDENTSVFIIDADGFDIEIPIKAETIAMSKPRMIDYTLYFDSSTLSKSENQYTGTVLTCGVMLLSLTVIISIFMKRKKVNHEKKD